MDDSVIIAGNLPETLQTSASSYNDQWLTCK
jgi:hypothetical protein